MSTALSCMYYDKTKCMLSYLTVCVYMLDLICLFLAPLQPLAINGREQRNRSLANGPIFTHHQHQLTSALPSAASLQSLSPSATSKPLATVAFTLPTPSSSSSTHEQSSSPAVPSAEDNGDREKLKADLQLLKGELQKSKETIARLQKSEEQMRERYS